MGSLTNETNKDGRALIPASHKHLRIETIFLSMLAVSVFHLRNNLPSRCIYIRTLTSSAQQAKDDVIRRKMLEKIIRVDHAGELGASYIYKGQMTILRNNKRAAPLIQEMWDQEKA